jgi:biopolymer transport protein ExbD
MSKKSLQREKEDPEIPTASMADIAFLLIVFFMLTTVFSANKGMEHILPPQEEDSDTIEPEDSIYIRIFPTGSYEIDKQSYSIDQVEKVYDYVNQKVQVNAKKPIIVHTNPEADYGDMVKVLNQLKQLEHDLELTLAITIPSKAEAARYEASGI